MIDATSSGPHITRDTGLNLRFLLNLLHSVTPDQLSVVPPSCVETSYNYATLGQR
jgi:hypothetical protein